jgi:hypothetical protein
MPCRILQVIALLSNEFGALPFVPFALCQLQAPRCPVVCAGRADEVEAGAAPIGHLASRPATCVPLPVCT